MERKKREEFKTKKIPERNENKALDPHYDWKFALNAPMKSKWVSEWRRFPLCYRAKWLQMPLCARALWHFIQLPLQSLKQIQRSRLLSFKVRNQPLVVWFPRSLLRPDISANKIFIANDKGIFAPSLSFFFWKILFIAFPATINTSLTACHPVEQKHKTKPVI